MLAGDWTSKCLLSESCLYFIVLSEGSTIINYVLRVLAMEDLELVLH